MASIMAKVRNVTRKLTGNAVLTIYTAQGEVNSLACQFNPDEYQLTARVKYSTQQRAQQDSPIIQYIGGDITTLNLPLLFDTSDTSEVTLGLVSTTVKHNGATDVSQYIDVLLQLVMISGEIHHPPMVEFTWGSLNISGLTQKSDVKYTMFEKGGMPVRARVNLMIIAPNATSVHESANPLESPDRTKCRVLSQGSSLWSIAQAEYGDAGLWREIARANGIMNPMDVPVGTVLKVPAL